MQSETWFAKWLYVRILYVFCLKFAPPIRLSRYIYRYRVPFPWQLMFISNDRGAAIIVSSVLHHCLPNPTVSFANPPGGAVDRYPFPWRRLLFISNDRGAAIIVTSVLHHCLHISLRFLHQSARRRCLL